MHVPEHSKRVSIAARPPPWRRLWEGVRTPMVASGSCLFAAERGRARRGTQLQHASGYGDREPYPLLRRAAKRSMHDALVIPRVTAAVVTAIAASATGFSSEGNSIMQNA